MSLSSVAVRHHKSERAKRIQLLDTLFSEAVRIRDNYVCQYCGNTTKSAQTHHIFTRQNFSTRYDMGNGVTLCFYCHRYRAHGGSEFTYWAERTWLGMKAFEKLHDRTRELVKVNDAWMDEQEVRLRAEIERLQNVVMP